MTDPRATDPEALLGLETDLTRSYGPIWTTNISDDFRPSFVPPLGEIIWEREVPSEDGLPPLEARIARTEGGRQVGYLRIPHFRYGARALAPLAEVFTRFERETDAVVLDQVDTPGGSMLQMYALLAYATDRPLATLPKHQLRLTLEDVVRAALVVARADDADANLARAREHVARLTRRAIDATPEAGRPTILREAAAAEVVFEGAAQRGIATGARPSAALVAYSRTVLDEATAGRGIVGGSERLTRPVHLAGVERIEPAAVHYTKRLVVASNELTFSAGEFLAATLQDARRATLFGATTAGAGGCAREVQLPDPLPATLTLTWTFARRANGAPIEDVGVQPDVPYEITVEDVRSGYRGYRESLLSALFP